MSIRDDVLGALRDVGTHLDSAANGQDPDSVRAAVLAAKESLSTAADAALAIPPASNGVDINGTPVDETPGAPVEAPIAPDTTLAGQTDPDVVLDNASKDAADTPKGT